MPAPLRSRNHLALALLIVGKLFGIGGLVVGSTARVLGGSLLALDGILIVAAVVVCLRTMKVRSEEDSAHKAALRQMVKEGTLKQYLRDLEAEEKKSADADASAEPSSERAPEPRPSQTAFS